MFRFPPYLSRPGRIARLCVHATCALALAACALPPAGDEQESAPVATTPKPAKPAKAVKPAGAKPGAQEPVQKEAGKDGAKDAGKDATNGWGLFRWGNNEGLADTGPGSFEGLRPDLGSFEQRGMASWYGKGFHGRRTANGERFDMRAMTAAHPSLPLDSWVLVRNLRNGKVAVVRINDRGPYHSNRVLDVSYGAARRLGFTSHGSTQVEIRRLSRSEVAALGPQTTGPDDDSGDGGDAGGGDLADALVADPPPRAARKARKPAVRRKQR